MARVRVDAADAGKVFTSELSAVRVNWSAVSLGLPVDVRLICLADVGCDWG